jgi:hypothetical protein
LNYYNYFTEIEETFVRRRGKNLFLSPLDWAMIEAWQDRGIPLHIVIRSIESVFDVFDQQPPGTRTIKSLLYCREEIEVQYAEWLTSQTGRSGDTAAAETSSAFTTDAVAEHIAKTQAILKGISANGISEDITRAVARLDELAGSLTDDFETVDKTLGDIEKLLDRAMLANWEPAHLKTIKKEVAGHLRGYKADMDPESYQNTFDLMLLKRLREEAGIPRLGLFYL